MFLLLLAVAVTPGLVLLSYFYIRDIYEAEPLRFVLLSFILGMLSVFPVMYLQTRLGSLIDNPHLHVLLVAAGVEELVKYLLLIAFIRKNKEVNETYDGILYSVAISLGFATVENVVSILPNGWETAAIRAFLPIPGHALFAVVMGYYAGRAKFEKGRIRILTLAQALLFAWLLHSVYDLILSSNHYLWGAVIIPFMIGLWILGLRKMKSAQEHSPFKPKY